MKLPMHASSLESVRLSVANLAAARHFWESALGFHCVGETAVDDPVLRRLWGTEGGEMRAARLERLGSTRLELFHWEGCTGKPIRDARRPWDLGVAELELQCVSPEQTLQHLAARGCEVLPGGGFVFLTPFGDRCRLTSGTEESVVLSIASLADCEAFFGGFLGWHPRESQEYTGIAGAASVSTLDSRMYSSNGTQGPGNIEAGLYRRTADPRLPAETAARMSPEYTGVWMLTASASKVDDPRAVEVEVPFVGRRRAVVTRAPGGVRFGVFERLG